MYDNSSQLLALAHTTVPLANPQFYKQPVSLQSPKSLEMWRSAARKASSSSLQKCLSCSCASNNGLRPLLPTMSILGFRQEASQGLDVKHQFRNRFGEAGCRKNRDMVSSPVGFLYDLVQRGFTGPANAYRAFASVAEEVSSTDVEDDVSAVDEIHSLLKQLSKEETGANCRTSRASEGNPAPKHTMLPKEWLGSNPESENGHTNGSSLPRTPNSNLPSVPPVSPPSKPHMSASRYKNLKRRQIKIETEAWEQAAKEYKELLADMCQHKLAPNLPYVKSLFMGWFEPLKSLIEEEQKLCREGRNKTAYAPYFIQLHPDMMAVITMHKIMALLMTGDGTASIRVVQAAISVGDAIEQEARIQRFLDKTRNKGAKQQKPGTDGAGQLQGDGDSSVTEEQQDTGSDVATSPVKDQLNLRKKVTSLMKKQKLYQVRKIVKQHDETKPWSQEMHAKVGSRLIEFLLDSAYIQPPVTQSVDGPPDIRPAFRRVVKNLISEKRGGPRIQRQYGVIECDPLVQQGLDRTARHMVIPYMPMLVPPVNWTGYDKGAHFFLPSYVMRTHGARQQREAVKRASRQQMQTVYEALDTLGSTRWKINKKVLSIVDRLWSSGGRLANLVDCEDVSLPEKPDVDDDIELKEWRKKLREAKKENSERHSLRCDVDLKLTVARKMKDEEGFFYPHNIDFRGRAYPMHPHLNHLGSDLCRGILEFAEGRPLGKSGLQWLKIHLANLYGGGVDKLSYDGRIAFAENNADEIFDSADRPLEGRRWWLDAEDPFQCLAVCMNLAEALRSPSPETIMSHLPVHQDGSCNGLQHYAALGRDKLGATAVNLVNGLKPADVYSGIAEMVLDIMQRDAAADPVVNSDAVHAKVLIDQVDRKLVKQTVMTSVYGVTYIGAREQIKKRLKERGFPDDDELFYASCYAAKVTQTALEEMFQAARGIMNWLGDCAKVIAMENHSVRWATPIGLPVVQPYRKFGRHLVKTSLQILTLQKETDKVMVKRQRTAFPPNFVHSLDGSHMMMTAIACKKAGLNFAGVHDSYWTHACDVDVMNTILREKFVELYEAPILENLVEDFQRSFPSLSFPSLPERGDFDLKEVLNSTYFFN